VPPRVGLVSAFPAPVVETGSGTHHLPDRLMDSGGVGIPNIRRRIASMFPTIGVLAETESFA